MQRLEYRISNALEVVADLLQHDEAFLPIFLRLEAELGKIATERAALDRAKAFVRQRP